jgi:1-phosphatidylinositol phosphodiesterase
MRVSFINASNLVLVLEHDGQAILDIEPRSTITGIKLGLRSKINLHALKDSTGEAESVKTASIANGPSIAINATKLSKFSAWSTLSEAESIGLRVYNIRVSRKQRKLLVLNLRKTNSFLSELPDTAPLSSLVLPGTHQTMAFHGWPLSQCQFAATTLSVQLRDGIRVLDIRLALRKSGLMAYHGPLSQKTPFKSMLSDIQDFLTAPETQRETIVMSIKQEDYELTTQAEFSAAVHSEIITAPGGSGMWFLENRIPRLGEVRGKCVLFSRFKDGDSWKGGVDGMGVHPSIWPDSARDGFSWQCKETLVRTQDWYNIGTFVNIPEKASLAAQNLIVVNSPPMPILPISFFSASSFPLALPPLVARGSGWPKLGMGVEGVNSRVCRWLIDLLGSDVESESSDGYSTGDDNVLLSEKSAATQAPVSKQDSSIPVPPPEARIQGWALLDYYASPEAGDLVHLLIEANFSARSPLSDLP